MKRPDEHENRVSQGTATTQRNHLRRLNRTLALTGCGALLLGGGALAANSALNPGDTIHGGAPSGPPQNRMAQDQTVLLSGASPIGGPWRLVSYRSEGVRDGSTVIEPRGLTCIRLILDDPPQGSPQAGSGWCGDVKGNFNAASLPIRDSSGRSEVLLFGNAPKSASAVKLTADGGKTDQVATRDGGTTYSGTVWAMPTAPALNNARVAWVHSNGSPDPDQRMVSDQLDRGRRIHNASEGRN